MFHVLAFQWKPDTSQAQKDRAAKEIAAFQGQIRGLLQTHVGPNISPRGKGYQRMVSTALMVFNDAILRVGIEYRLSIIDLRFVWSSPEDYANPIDPSSIGGAKIARSIVSLIGKTFVGSIVTA